MNTQRDIYQWAAATFPDATMGDVSSKLYDEMIELYQDITGFHEDVAGEIADVAILLYQIAERSGVDLDMAVARKFDELKGRTWVRQNSGTYQHVEGE